MNISEKSWERYIERLRKVNKTAAEKMLDFLHLNRDDDGLWNSYEARQLILEYAYSLSTQYGEAAAELACEMYDQMGELSGVDLPSAEPAATATFQETAKAVNGALKSDNADIVASAVERLVKLSEVDTVLNNALRDGAEWAWIPHGDTCAYCIMLASQGWQPASRDAIRNGHAEHIHANCDCTYAVRFDDRTDVQGYKPKKYLKMYNGETIDKDIREDILEKYGRWSTDAKMNAMRRQVYRDNKDAINARKRAEYALRKEREQEE